MSKAKFYFGNKSRKIFFTWVLKYVDYKMCYFITLTLRTSVNLKFILRKWEVLLQNWSKTGVSETNIHKSSGKWTDSFIDISQKKKTDMVSKHKQRFNMMSQIKKILAQQHQLWEGIEVYCMLVSAENTYWCHHFRSH